MLSVQTFGSRWLWLARSFGIENGINEVIAPVPCNLQSCESMLVLNVNLGSEEKDILFHKLFIPSFFLPLLPSSLSLSLSLSPYCFTVTYPLSKSNLTIDFCEVSMALMSGVPPLSAWASMLAPESSNNLTTSS